MTVPEHLTALRRVAARLDSTRPDLLHSLGIRGAVIAVNLLVALWCGYAVRVAPEGGFVWLSLLGIAANVALAGWIWVDMRRDMREWAFQRARCQFLIEQFQSLYGPEVRHFRDSPPKTTSEK
jgi:hypothetical protein